MNAFDSAYRMRFGQPLGRVYLDILSCECANLMNAALAVGNLSKAVPVVKISGLD